VRVQLKSDDALAFGGGSGSGSKGYSA